MPRSCPALAPLRVRQNPRPHSPSAPIKIPSAVKLAPLHVAGLEQRPPSFQKSGGERSCPDKPSLLVTVFGAELSHEFRNSSALAERLILIKLRTEPGGQFFRLDLQEQAIEQTQASTHRLPPAGFAVQRSCAKATGMPPNRQIHCADAPSAFPRISHLPAATMPRPAPLEPLPNPIPHPPSALNRPRPGPGAIGHGFAGWGTPTPGNLEGCWNLARCTTPGTPF